MAWMGLAEESMVLSQNVILLNYQKETVEHCYILVCVCVSSVTQSCLTLKHYELCPTRYFCPWDFSGKNTGVIAIFFSRE